MPRSAVGRWRPLAATKSREVAGTRHLRCSLMEFPQVDGAAPADSSLGLLERGRGAGWTDAAASGSGSDLLLACLRREPRWDRQVESRADYYATLSLHLNVPVSSFSSLAFESEEDDRWIVLDVLE